MNGVRATSAGSVSDMKGGLPLDRGSFVGSPRGRGCSWTLDLPTPGPLGTEQVDERPVEDSETSREVEDRVASADVVGLLVAQPEPFAGDPDLLGLDRTPRFREHRADFLAGD